MEDTTTQFSAGWYEATDRPGELGFWDGEQWTGEFKPIDERRSPFAKRTPEEKATKAAAKAQRAEERELQRFRGSVRPCESFSRPRSWARKELDDEAPEAHAGADHP